MKIAKKKLSGIDEDVWAGLDFYYNEIRNDLYHDSAAKTLTDSAILDYEETVIFVLDRAFGVHLSDLVQTALVSAAPAVAETVTPDVDWSRLVSRTDRLLAAVSVLAPRGADDVNRLFKKEGVLLRLKTIEFSNIVARNSGTKNLFYFDKEQKRWLLSGSGKFKLSSLQRRTES